MSDRTRLGMSRYRCSHRRPFDCGREPGEAAAPGIEQCREIAPALERRQVHQTSASKLFVDPIDPRRLTVVREYDAEQNDRGRRCQAETLDARRARRLAAARLRLVSRDGRRLNDSHR